jgi:hypothetical protein
MTSTQKELDLFPPPPDPKKRHKGNVPVKRGNLRCPACGWFTGVVAVDSVLNDADAISAIRRTRQCTKCDYRFGTVERLISEEMCYEI